MEILTDDGLFHIIIINIKVTRAMGLSQFMREFYVYFSFFGNVF